MKIRKAILEDVRNVAKLFNDYRVWYEKDADMDGAKAFLTERIKRDESVILIAENEDDSLAGFTQLYPVFSSTRMKRLWLLNDLFVDENYRGQGISKMLIDGAKDHCRETGGCAVTLETQKDNTIGNQLYPHVGFELNKDHNFYEWTCD